LQELLPNSPQIPIHTARPDGAAESQNIVPQQSPRKKISSMEPKLKVRILTWNMHDSLPKVVFLSPYTMDRSNSYYRESWSSFWEEFPPIIGQHNPNIFLIFPMMQITHIIWW
jgi:hypothetical protein